MKLVIKGQVRGGKNNMKITRTGKHYPDPLFVAWRDEACWQLKGQLKKVEESLPIKDPVSITIDYIAGDRKIRDVPAILDALWHVLNKVGVVEDDSQLGGLGCSVHFNFCGVDKNHPQVTMII